MIAFTLGDLAVGTVFLAGCVTGVILMALVLLLMNLRK